MVKNKQTFTEMALDLEEKFMEYENILFSEENTDWIGLCWIKMIDGQG